MVITSSFVISLNFFRSFLNCFIFQKRRWLVIFVLSVFLLDLSGCAIDSSSSGSQSYNVTTNISILGNLRNRVYWNTTTMNKICRGTPLTNKNARRAISNSNCAKGFIEDKIMEEFFPKEDEAAAGTQASETNQEPPVRVPVSDNYMELGLEINNGTNNFLVIHSLEWIATAESDGRTLVAAGSIDTGYCSDIERGDGGVDFLYFIPPGCASRFRKGSTSALDNLLIFLEGFEAIDRREEAGSASAGSGEEVSGGSVQGLPPQDIFFRGEEVIEIPSYTVTIILRGDFFDAENEVKGEFYTQERFFTQPISIP